MPLRSVKMKRFIFGFHRRVWCPKWTPLSSSLRMVTTATLATTPLAVVAGGPGRAAAWRPVAGRVPGAVRRDEGGRRLTVAGGEGRARSTTRGGRRGQVYALAVVATAAVPVWAVCGFLAGGEAGGDQQGEADREKRQG